MKYHIAITAFLFSDLTSENLTTNAHKLLVTSPEFAAKTADAQPATEAKPAAATQPAAAAAQPAAAAKPAAAQSEGHPAVWPNTAIVGGMYGRDRWGVDDEFGFGYGAGPVPLYGPGSVPLYSPGLNPLYAPGLNPLYAPGLNPLYAPGPNPLYAPGPNPLYAPGSNPLYAPGVAPWVPPQYQYDPNSPFLPPPPTTIYGGATQSVYRDSPVP